MAIPSTTQSYIDEVEKFMQRKFQFRHEVALLLDEAAIHSQQKLLDEIAFSAKFVVNASNILKREGTGREETAKLEHEFKDGIEHSSSLLRELIAGVSDDERNLFTSRFLSISHDGMNNLMKLLYELSWLKNYSLDTQRQSKQ